MRKSNFLLTVSWLIIGFIIGFYTNAILLETSLPFLPPVMQAGAKVRDAGSTIGVEKTNWIDVSFDGTSFLPSTVSLPWGKAMVITNKSTTTLMRLESKHPDLRTPRGYGLEEKLRVVLMNPGEYEVTVRDVPKAVLTITVTGVRNTPTP